jgi:hypothetical protein
MHQLTRLKPGANERMRFTMQKTGCAPDRVVLQKFLFPPFQLAHNPSTHYENV